jgi:hypothetical protein
MAAAVGRENLRVLGHLDRVAQFWGWVPKLVDEALPTRLAANQAASGSRSL